MKRPLAILLAAIVSSIAIIGWLGTNGDSPPLAGESPSPRHASSTAPDDLASAERAALVEADEERSPELVARRVVETTPSADDTSPASEPRAMAEVRARFTLPSGLPAMGARARLDGWASTEEHIERPDSPVDWRDLEVTTDTEGHLRLRFVAPHAFHFTLEVGLPGYVVESWRWSELEPDAVVDLGDVTLRAGGTIVGRVLDADGRALREGWRIEAEAGNLVFGTKRPPSVSGSIDPVDGRFRLEGVAPGQVRVRACSQLTGWIDGPRIQVRAGEVHEVDIRHEGADPARTILVRPKLDRHWPFLPGNIRVRLTAVGFERELEGNWSGHSDFSFEDLVPGEYTAIIDDPRFEPWRKDGIATGRVVQALLRGSAAVQLDLRDAASGEPIERYRARTRYDDRNMSPNLFEVHPLEGEGRPAMPAGWIGGLLPETQTLTIDAPGRAAIELSVPELRPGEIRQLAAQLFESMPLRGRVRADPPGGRLRGVTVQLGEAGSGPTEPPSMWSETVGEGFLQAVEVDEAGRFEFADVRPGRYALHAWRSTFDVTSRSIELRADAPDEEFELVLPRAAGLEVEIDCPAGADLEGIYLGGRTQDEPVVASDEPYYDLPPCAPATPDGPFHVGDLPATDFLLSLRFPLESAGAGGDPALGEWLGMKLGPVSLVAGETTRVRYDLRDRWPGALEVEVLEDGQPIEGLLVQVTQVRERTGTGLYSDTDGLARFPLAPVGEYRVEVFGGHGEWGLEWPTPAVVRGGERTRVSFAFTLAPGRVRLRSSETGEPLAGVDVRVNPPGMRISLTKRTDAEGFLELEFPPGSLTIRYPLRGGAKKSLEWGAFGPVQEELAFP